MTRGLGVGAALVVLLFPMGALAQQGAIAGVVRDTTGAVLPGVTVEAASPALIEKVRVVTTDSTGQYRIVDLRPGAYSVTFTLPGFSSVRREGIELNAGFTANVTVELRVGSVEETVTVSGASPLVDVQNVRQQRVVTREMMEVIPTGKQYTQMAALVPGVIIGITGGGIAQDVGGNTGMNHARAMIHGSREPDAAPRVNGMSIASITSQGNSRSNLQDSAVEEFVMQLAASPAEFPYGGIYANMIPKQGGNTYSSGLFIGGTAESLHTDNLDDDLRQRGLLHPSKVKHIFDVNPSLGGPIARDRLWFFSAYRQHYTANYVPGLYDNKDVRAWKYEMDLTRRSVNDQDGKAGSVNLTWQMNPKNKFTLFYQYDFQCWCRYGLDTNASPEAVHQMDGRNNLAQATWASTVTNKLLLEGALSRYFFKLPRDQEPEAVEPAILEQSTGKRYRSSTGYARNDGIIDHYRAAVSYVTGTHAFKAGFELEHQWSNDTDHSIGSRHYRVLNGVPNQVTYTTLPFAWQAHMYPLGVYAQDQWTVSRWTVNAGLRYDYFKGTYPASDNPPTEFLPVARSYPGATVLGWHDLNPRLGVSWDVFGTGRTAIKATLSRYISQEGKQQTNANHPVTNAVNNIARTWTDRNGDFEINGDPFNPAANGELGPSPNANFGKPITTLTMDPDWTFGYGKRPFNWETSVGVQHEIRPGLSANVAYFRRSYGNDIVTDNTLVSPSDYDPFCITAPVDSRLPGGGGQQICGLYDLNPSKVGQVADLRTYPGKYGVDVIEIWNGVDATMNLRLPNGVLVQGGTSTGKTLSDNCEVLAKLDNPSQYNCHRETPFLTQVKFLASYPLPWYGIQVSGTFQHIRKDPVDSTNPNGSNARVMGLSANYVATNAVIAPSLGRNLSSTSNVTVDLIQQNPGIYLDDVNQVDFRLAKTFRVGRTRLQGQFDLYNLLNANPVIRYNVSYGTTGASWLVPQSQLPGRLIRFGLQANF